MSSGASNDDGAKRERTLWLIGDRVGHSKSPAMQNAALAAIGWRNWSYRARSIPVTELSRGWRELRDEPSFAGANCTIPHKQAIIDLLDDVTPAATAVGAVNTITVTNGHTVGHNTDIDGVEWPLRKIGFDGAGVRVTLVGSGGAARAVVAALVRLEVATIDLVVRNPERAEPFVDDMTRLARVAGHELSWSVTATASTAEIAASVARARLIVNATPLGFTDPYALPLPEAAVAEIDAQSIVFDCVYRRPRSAFVARAIERGATVVDGFEMLLRQGARAFELWTEQEAPVDAMRAALG